jgi:nicotinate-nucleotide pyrophosphorylase (carboxylating)
MNPHFDELTDHSIDLWIAEDIGEGDHTTFSTIPPEATGKAVLLAKSKGIVAGIEPASKVIYRFDPELRLTLLMPDGSAVNSGDRVFEVSGSVRSILQTERLVLNIIQRMSGIASQTREYVQLLEGFSTRILDTRKTTPGLRYLEKEAVRLGGGVNHRFGLYDMILIKDNHIDFAGGITQAIRKTREYLTEHNLSLKIEVEARSLKDVEEILAEGGIDRILLDNFTPEKTLEAVSFIGGRVQTESSGNITRENIRRYAECGVDYISVGALTHQIKSLDFSLKAFF